MLYIVRNRHGNLEFHAGFCYSVNHKRHFPAETALLRRTKEELTEKIKTIEGVKYTMSVDIITGINFNLNAEAGEGVAAPIFDENKFSVSFYSDKKKGYYIQDAKADSFTFNKENGSCWGRVSSSTVENAAGIGFVDSDFTTNDRVEVKYQLAPGKNIIWKIRLESTATTTVR